MIAPSLGAGCDAVNREQYQLLVRLSLSPREPLPTEEQFADAMTAHLRRTGRCIPCWADTVDVAKSIWVADAIASVVGC
jgi:hypothetical protein